MPLFSAPLGIPLEDTITFKRPRSILDPSREQNHVEIEEDFCGKRLAKFFGRDLYFGNFSEKIRGPLVDADRHGD